MASRQGPARITLVEAGQQALQRSQVPVFADLPPFVLEPPLSDRNLGGLRSTDHRLGTRRRRVDHLELQQLFPPVDAPPVDRVAGRAELLHPLRLAVVGVNLV